MSGRWRFEIRGRHPWFAPLAGAVACALVWLGAAPAGWAQAELPPDSAAYLLIIDHSGSMGAKMPSGKTRWEEMQDKAVELIRHVPLESHVWIAVFAGDSPQPELPPFATEQDRAALIAMIRDGYGPPGGGTALYDTLGMAFEEAERLAIRHPGRHISVMAYTDGEDNGSKRWNPQNLTARFKQLVGENRNLWLFYTRIEGEGAPIAQIVDDPRATEGTFKNPLPLRMVPSAVVLKNPKLHPQQVIELEFGGSDHNWHLLQGTSLAFQFVPESGQPLAVQAREVPFRKGTVPVALEVTNPGELEADRDYGGILRIRYPVLEKHEVQAADAVEVGFQKEERAQIYDRRPVDEATFAAGEPIHFWVNTLQGARVLWDFGDEQSATGAEVRHVYNTAGPRAVKVSVEADPRIGATTQEFTIHIIDIGASVDPVDTLLVEGVPAVFRSTGRGPIERYEWLVNGQKFAGQARDDGREAGSQLRYTFLRPGRHVVSVMGFAEQAVVHAEERQLDVLARPAIAVEGPSPLPFGQPVQFRLVSPPGWQQVVWHFDDEQTDRSSAINPLHTYQSRGAFQVRAEVTWQDGTVLEAQETIHVMAEPPVARPRVRTGREGTQRVIAGATVRLEDDSSGDIVQRRWFHNERELAPGQVSLSLQELGESRLSLWVAGPPDREGNVQSDRRDVVFHVWKGPNHFLFWTSLFGMVVLVAGSGKLLLGNAPRKWRIYYSNQQAPDEDDDPCITVSEGWKWWAREKYGEIPLSRFFDECDYWGTGAGAREAIKITASRKRAGWNGALEYSGDGNPSVVSIPPRGDDTRSDYQWRDNRCPDDEYKTFYMRLVKVPDSTPWLFPLLLLSLSVVLIGLVGLVYQRVYHQSL